MSAAEADRFLDYLLTERNYTVALINPNIRRLQYFDYFDITANRALAFYESRYLKQTSYCDVCPSCGC